MQRSFKRPIYVVALVCTVLSFHLAGIYGCNNGDNARVNNADISRIANELNEIALDLSEVSNRILDEDTTGRIYVDEEDRQEVKKLDDALNDIEKQIANINENEIITEDIAMLMIEKESLHQLANSIISYIDFRDNNESAEYILMSLPLMNSNYYAEAFEWLSYISGWEPNPYDEQQIIAYFFGKYMKSAEDNCLLSYYEMDDRIFEADKQGLQALLDHYDENLKRIIEELGALNLSEEWLQIRDASVDTLLTMDEQNSFLMGTEWPIDDTETLEQMLAEYLKNRDEMDKLIIPLLGDRYGS